MSLSPVLDLDTSRNSVFLGDNLGTLYSRATKISIYGSLFREGCL